VTVRVLLLVVLLAAPLATEAQETPRVRLGFISSSTTNVSSPFLAALRQGLKDLGYDEGRNLTIAYRFAESRDQLPGMAAELVKSRVDVILAGGSEGILAAKNATSTIPIVMTNSGDAVREGFVVSLARPGGNITGLTQISPELSGKRLQLLKDLLPRLGRVGRPLASAPSEHALHLPGDAGGGAGARAPGPLAGSQGAQGLRGGLHHDREGTRHGDGRAAHGAASRADR